MKIALISTSTYPGDQGLRYVSSSLQKAGHQVDMFFMTDKEDYKKVYSKKVLDQLKEKVKDCGLIGVSSMASTSIRAKQIIRYLKGVAPIVWGGVHPTMFPDECLNEADIVCVGEGEDAIVDVANAIEKKKEYDNIKNIWTKNKKNPVRMPPGNLDKYPWPDFDITNHWILDKNQIRRFREQDWGGMLFYQTERGCPNACTYCVNKKLRSIYAGKGKIIRTHSVDYMIKHLKWITSRYKSIGVIDLRDETFFVRPLNVIKEFCERYKKEIGVRMKCLADPTTMNEEKLKLMIDAGLTDVIIGIQSGSDRLNFEVYKRYIKREKVKEAARIINKYRKQVTVMYDIITCNPYETDEDILESINIIRELPKPFYLSVNNLVFFKGSELYDRAKKEDIIKTEKDSAFDLNYWDRWKHIKLKRKNEYLTLVLNLMRGVCTNKKYGLLPAFILNRLIKPSAVKYRKRHKILTYMFGNVVQIMDFFREHVAKPVFRSMPTGFRVWYDRVRYK